MIQRKEILDTIIKECYWDYNITVNDLEKILEENNPREIHKLFSKIIYNSKDKLLALSIFTQKQLKEHFEKLKVTFNHKYITKHILILKSLLLNENVVVKGLEWKKR